VIPERGAFRRHRGHVVEIARGNDGQFQLRRRGLSR
jgi:hypothetical protein